MTSGNLLTSEWYLETPSYILHALRVLSQPSHRWAVALAPRSPVFYVLDEGYTTEEDRFIRQRFLDWAFLPPQLPNVDRLTASADVSKPFTCFEVCFLRRITRSNIVRSKPNDFERISNKGEHYFIPRVLCSRVPRTYFWPNYVVRLPGSLSQ